jgi:hypothetical protein
MPRPRSTLETRERSVSAGIEEVLEVQEHCGGEEVTRMRSKLHAVYGVFIVQREGLR